YAAALDQLTPQPYLSQQTGAMMTGLGFLDGMMSCRGPDGPLAPLRERDCTWFRFTGGVTNQQSGADTLGYREAGELYQVGVQQQVAPNWFRGFGTSFDSARTTTTSSVINSQRGDIGLSVKHEVGNWLFAGGLDLGVATLDSNRSIDTATGTASAKSQSSIWHADARFRAVYLLESGRNYAKPSVDFDLIQLYMPGFSEYGAGPLNLDVHSSSQTVAVVSPNLEMGTTIPGEDANVVARPYVSSGFSVFSNNSWSATSTLAGAPSGIGAFNTTTSFPGTIFKASAGVEFISGKKTNAFDLRFGYDGQFASGYQSHTGSVKAIWRF